MTSETITDDQIIQKINNKLVSEFEFEPELVKPESRLVEDMGMDSLDFVDLVVVLQEAFGVSFNLREDPRIKEVRTLGDLHLLVLEKKREMEKGREEPILD